MALTILVESVPLPRPALALLQDRIVQIVSERSGIKETDLIIDIMADFIARDQFDEFYDPITDRISAEVIFTEIHRMIDIGRIIGVDFEIGDGGYTFLLPPRTNIRFAMPVKAIPRTTH